MRGKMFEYGNTAAQFTNWAAVLGDIFQCLLYTIFIQIC